MWFPLSLCPPKSCGTVGLYAHCDHPLNGWGSQGLVGDIATLGRDMQRGKPSILSAQNTHSESLKAKHREPKKALGPPFPRECA